jgi:hypothetical protein
VSGVKHRALQLGFFAEAPAIFVGWLAWFVSGHGGAGDFSIFRHAGQAVVHGHSPYVRPTFELLADNDRFVYPEPVAYLFVPFVGIPDRVGAVLFLVLSVTAVLTSLWLLGVRDWRCYGAALLGAPVFGALGVGAVGPLLMLAVAAGWRLRHRVWVGVLFAVATATKLFLWPLLIWLLVTRRFRAATAAAATLLAIALVWLVADPEGLGRYPTTVSVLNEVQRTRSYSSQALALALGAPAGVAVAVCVLIAIAGIAVLSRMRDERHALAASVIVALLATPILWLHYLVLLLVPLALTTGRFTLLWMLPVTLWITPHPESAGSVWKIVAAFAAVGTVTVVGDARAHVRTRRPGLRNASRTVPAASASTAAVRQSATCPTCGPTQRKRGRTQIQPKRGV